MEKYGVIFDFNGTLFWDTKLQNDSWDEFLTKYGFSLSDEEKEKYVHGINMKDSFEFIFKRQLDADEVYRLSEEKEVIYRGLCLERGMELAPGAINLIEFLKTNGVEIAIATASGKTNVDFFIEHFYLLDYFKSEYIIYNDGSIRGKPSPDLFNKAIEIIDVEKQNVTIFEDSLAGLEAAKNSGAGNVIIVNGTGEKFDTYSFQNITHFDEFKRSSFRLN